MKSSFFILLAILQLCLGCEYANAQCGGFTYLQEPFPGAPPPPVGLVDVLISNVSPTFAADSMASAVYIDGGPMFGYSQTFTTGATPGGIFVFPAAVSGPVTHYVCNAVVYYFAGLPVCSDSVCQTVIINPSAGCGSFYVNAGSDISVPMGALYPLGYTAPTMGGTPPFSYYWYSSDATANAALSAITSINPNINVYSGLNASICLEVTDAAGCTVSDCVQVEEGPCSLSSSLSFDSLSNHISNGVTDIGGSVLTYLWNTGATTQDINYIATGGVQTFSVTVSDQWGCSVVSVIDVIDYDASSTPCSLSVINDGTGVLIANVSPGPAYFEWTLAGTTTVLFYSGPDYSSTFYPDSALFGISILCTATSLVAGISPCSEYDSIISIGCSDTICGRVFDDVNYNAMQDATEPGIAGYFINSTYGTATTDANGDYLIIMPCGVVFDLWTSTTTTSTILTLPLPSYTSAISPVTAVYTGLTSDFDGCNFNFGFNTSTSIISGYVFNDINANGIFDATESAMPYGTIMIGGTTAYANAVGFYEVFVLPGTYTLTATYSGAADVVSISPSSSTVTATTGSVTANTNFGIHIIPGLNLSVSITPHTTVTPGFPAWYDLQVCNNGTVASSGIANVFFDTDLMLSYSSPTYTSLNASAHTISYAIPVLAPGECYYIWIDFDAATSSVLGDVAIELANIIPTLSGDINTTNNTDTVQQIIIGSWDPNNKLPVHSNIAADPNTQNISSNNANQRIEYIINFQNTGSASAVNIVVEDILSADVDPASFVFLGSSHDAHITRVGSEVRYQFSNIMLPDSTNNEPQSHGWISFSVNADAGLAAGHVISDPCAIYFDFNAPVITNDGAVILINTNGISNIAELGIKVFPNPMSETLFIQQPIANQSATVELYDVVGKRVISKTLSQADASIDVRTLSSGIYTCKIKTIDGRVATSMVVK